MCDLHEMALEIYRLLCDVQKRDKLYHDLANSYGAMVTLCDDISSSQENRLFANYYRVGFYGKGLLLHNGKEYIYKELATVRLADFTERIKTEFGENFGMENIVILKNTRDPVDEALKESEKVHIQIASVVPQLDSTQETETSVFYRQWNIDKFVLNTPFVKGEGKPTAADQWTLRTVYTVATPFPSFTKRTLVVDKTAEELSPIVNAINLIHARTGQTMKETRSAAPNLKTLQIVLQGSVLLQVNAGPLEICQTFLKDESKDGSRQNELRAEMKTFALETGKAVRLNSNYIGLDQRNLQIELEKGYLDLIANLRNFGVDISDAEVAEFVTLPAEEEEEEEEEEEVEEIEDLESKEKGSDEESATVTES
eukprot:TRINITY_DN809_c0_g3_i1.p1 TRINITY_DN809_c0_g3~~TRINITY_DN809_c0_g3_i1.p1  ORF type:complete len:369 (+),score=88.68 TRINITY_DN809_c0_g3_i1:181-1287(+)